ncbi:hypothetical protein [Pseudoglutamicibacter albus]|uniref:Uncharacterized protein n=1 Tax=Pseudoglutamicibacter albus TaxID=98671 RepID=A0ABU1YZ92_9MICC|nr:hypothetical protein [Pseudoglutamicibacter albus]MDR7292851.1 hypothetical protein [Pseudoglutamicibacter albus]
MTAKNSIVDANGNELREAPGFLPYLYRVVLYSIIFRFLLTLRGFIQEALPEKEKPPKPDARDLETTQSVRMGLGVQDSQPDPEPQGANFATDHTRPSD